MFGFPRIGRFASMLLLPVWSTGPALMFSFSTSTRRNNVPSGSSEPSGSSTSRIVCRSWNRGQCSAPGAACRFAHRCSRCSGVPVPHPALVSLLTSPRPIPSGGSPPPSPCALVANPEECAFCFGDRLTFFTVYHTSCFLSFVHR